MAEQMLSSRSFQNHIKLGLGFFFTKVVLEEFVREDTEEFIKSVLNQVYKKGSVPGGNHCNICHTPNVLKCPTKDICGTDPSRCRFHSGACNSYRTCPNGICDQIKESVNAEHRSEPVWKNTDASKWCSCAVEVAKCFMPAKGYTDVDSFSEIDFYGIISVIINNKRFQNKLCIHLSKKENLCIKVRQMSNEYRHSANLSLEDQDLIGRLDLLITLLQDPKYLESKSKVAVKTLHQLKTDTFEVCSSLISRVLSDAIKDREHTAIKNISEHEQQLTLKLLHELQDRYRVEAKAVTANSLAEVIDTKVVVLLEIAECAKKQKASIARAGNREQRKLQKAATNLRRSLDKGNSQEKDADHAQLETSIQTDGSIKQGLFN